MKRIVLTFAFLGVLLATGAADRPLARGVASPFQAASVPGFGIQTPAIPAPRASSALRYFGKPPIYFIPNSGQVDGPVDFYVRGKDKSVYFTPSGVTFALNFEEKLWAVKMDFAGARKDVKPEGLENTGAVISYFKGKPENWHAGLPAYSKIIYRGLWPGIDLVYKGDFDKLKYEFIVHPGADPNAIRIALRGAENAWVDDAGRMEIATPGGSFEDETPSAYQDVGGPQTKIPVAFKLAETDSHPEASGLKSYEFGFDVGAYDKSRDVVLDPAIFVYCGYVGGLADDSSHAIAVDAAGNAYITGETSSTAATFPVTVGPNLTNKGPRDAFVAKVNSAGTALVYCGYIGGAADEIGYGIAVDGSGNAYIAGLANSSETTFPVTVGPDLTQNGGWDAFVAKVNPAGTALVYCGYIGGSATEYGYGIAVDASGNAYVAGKTQSNQASFPATIGPDLTQNGSDDAFVAKVKADGTGFVYCGYIGGSSSDMGYGIAVDRSGNAYIAGQSYSSASTFPVTVGPDLTQNGDSDVFVAKIRTDGTGLVYCGYIGGSGNDTATAIAVDGSGYAYITGFTYSSASTFPVAVGPDLTQNGQNDAFVAKVKADGTGLIYCGYIGGSNYEFGSSIAVDGLGNAYIAGSSSSPEATFPVKLGPDLTQNGNWDAFAAKVRADGSALVYCSFIGGSGMDYGDGIAVDGFGNAYVAGSTDSTAATFPVTVGPDVTQNLGTDAYIAKIQSGFSLTISAGAGGTTNPNPGTYRYDENSSASVQAVAADAFQLDSWSGDASGSANPLTIVMDGNKAIQANFTRVVKPPLGLSGIKLANRSLSMIEYIVRLTWQANPANSGTTRFRVYQIENGQPALVAEVAAEKLQYVVRNVQKTKAYSFGVTALNNLGWESDMAQVVVQ